MIRLTLALFLLAAPASAQICVCLKCAFGSYGSYYAPSGSMKPTLEPGQCAIFNRTIPPRDIPAGSVTVYRHPTQGTDFLGRLMATEGQTIQLISGRVYIDGTALPTTPADAYTETMERQGPQGSLPRCPTATDLGGTCTIPRLTETLGGETYEVLNLQDGGMLDDTPPFTVPAGHVFMMGDHRDNSTDSRIPQSSRGVGFVPVENIIGVLDEIIR